MSTSPDSEQAPGSTPPVAPPPSTTMNNRLKDSWNNPAKRPTLIFGFGAVGIALILLIIAALQLITGPEAAPPPSTPTAACTGPNCPVAQASPLVPKKLFVRDRTFDITPVSVQKGKWPVSDGQEGSATWVFGSLVNYLIGLPNTAENKDLLQAISEADAITLELSDGQTVQFKFDAQQLVSPNSKEIFSQQHPGITLLLLGDDGEQRLIVTGAYDVEKSEANRSVPSNVVAINTPVEIGPVRVKALGGRLVENAPGIPVGSVFYLVDFTAENISEATVNAADFQLDLMDYARQKWPLSPTASKLGPNPPPGGQLLPGLSATFTSGFEVPSNITGPILTWIFKPTSAFKGQASVAVPLLGPTPTPDPRSQVTAQISQVYYTPDQSELVVVGSIANPTNVLIPVGPSDIVLSAPDTNVLATLNNTDPGLPWRLNPNDKLDFTLRFSRLPSRTAILKILNNSFELTVQ